MVDVSTQAIPEFLKIADGAAGHIVEKHEGDRMFYWPKGEQTARLSGDWTGAELMAAATMMGATNANIGGDSPTTVEPTAITQVSILGLIPDKLERLKQSWNDAAAGGRMVILEAGERLHTPPPPVEARPLGEWYEELGDVLWWLFNEDGLPAEAPWVGSPLCLGHTVELHAGQGPLKDSLLFRGQVGGWPGYHTHWTPLPASPMPTALLATPAEGGGT